MAQVQSPSPELGFKMRSSADIAAVAALQPAEQVVTAAPRPTYSAIVKSLIAGGVAGGV
jgi:hypothetical protein